MAQINPFLQQGKCCLVTANTSGSLPTPIQVPGSGSNSPLNYTFTNNGSVTAFIGWGAASGDATTNSVVPTGTGANSQQCFPILPGSQIVRTFPPGTFFCGITASGTAAIFIEPGEGQ